jgi:hypothetical protein
MEKLNERLTLVANLSVVVGIVFLAVELRQNTNMMRAQIRDSVTEKQMEYYGWVATNPETADVLARGRVGGLSVLADEEERLMYSFLVQGVLREFENSQYQYEQGLFTAEEFEPRKAIWRIFLSNQGSREVWQSRRETYAPSFRAQLDSIVAGLEN